MTPAAPPQDRTSTAGGAAAPAAEPVRPRAASPSFGVELLRAARPLHWVKNLLVFVPLLLAHEVDRAARLPAVAWAFLAFCLCASGAYVLNDLLDREADRKHPLKRTRPLAAGRLAAPAAAAFALALFAAGLGLALQLLPRAFTATLALYSALTTLYSAWLKRKLLLDVFFLAGLYTLRVLAGGAAGGVRVSEWLLAFCIFFFLSLAFAKRYAELLRVRDESGQQVPGRAYRVEDLAILESVGPASGYLSVLVMAFYVNSAKAGQLYRSPALLWLLCPVLLYWITRLWFAARRHTLDEDPILYALKDRASLITTGAGVLLVVLAWWDVPGVG